MTKLKFVPCHSCLIWTDASELGHGTNNAWYAASDPGKPIQELVIPRAEAASLGSLPAIVASPQSEA
jgi:hypothetical protein